MSTSMVRAVMLGALAAVGGASAAPTGTRR